MQQKIRKVLFGGITFLSAFNTAIALAQDNSERAVEQYACKDILRESGPNRDVAIAFLHGFLLGRSGGSKFNVETLTKQTNTFLDRCLENPHDKAVDVMTKIKS